MLKYILSLSLIVISINTRSQDKDIQITEDKKGNPGISIGIDLAPVITRFFTEERIGFEANARLAIKKRWFAVGELGYENINLDNDKLTYTSDGSFLRLGVDYNVFNVDEIDNNDNILLGLRYGFAVQDHQCQKYIIQEDYWGNYTGSVGSSTIGSHWAEFVFGLRSEILKNFYLGWSVRLRTVINVGSDNELEPYSIPGYGRSDKLANLGFTYTLEYHIPFRKNR